MSEDGGRPGGLTVLAILSFAWGGVLTLGQLALAVSLAMGKQKEFPEPVASIKSNVLWMSVGGNLLSAALLVTAGIGYLGQRRVLGRAMGSVYAVVSLLVLSVIEAVEPRLFSIETVMGVIYSLLILLLVNVTFRHDLVR
jgi:hypothetical protein